MQTRSVLLVVCVAAYACASSNNVRVIDLVQDRNSKDYENCPQGRVAYVWPDQRIAVCWPQQVTAYVVCVEHLALASRSSEETRKAAFEASAKVLDKVDASTKISSEDAKKWIETMVNDGEIAKARAQAIATCARLLDVKEAAAVKAFLSQ